MSDDVWSWAGTWYPDPVLYDFAVYEACAVIAFFCSLRVAMGRWIWGKQKGLIGPLGFLRMTPASYGLVLRKLRTIGA